MKGKLYVTPILNTMGPVVDEKHQDLLKNWNEIDSATEKYFSDEFRNSLIDSSNQPVAISWFPINWTGFETNPVKRDFGWFTIYDHFLEKFKVLMSKYNDGIYWMYNHPDKSGVGNAWGLDWLENIHYIEILNRLIIERNFFPGVMEVPTFDTNTSSFAENYFPFNLANRNSSFINWDNIEADGRKTREILQWADAPKDWSFYHPSEKNHQIHGDMKQMIFRLLDIKTRIMEFPDDEIIMAFERCKLGHDVIIAGYEHDFRDRSDVVKELFLRKINRIWKEKYHDIETVNLNFQTSIRKILNINDDYRPSFNVVKNKDYIKITSNCELYNNTPYIVIHDLVVDSIFHLNPTKFGLNSWGFQQKVLPTNYIIAIAGFSISGLQNITKFHYNGDTFAYIDHKGKNIPMELVFMDK